MLKNDKKRWKICQIFSESDNFHKIKENAQVFGMQREEEIGQENASVHHKYFSVFFKSTEEILNKKLHVFVH